MTNKEIKMKRKTALVLGGGGAFGAYEIGVYKALIKINKKYDMVLGTSVGAINGALIAQGDFESALSIWKTLNTKMIFDVDVSEQSYFTTAKAMMLFAIQFLKYGGANTSPLKRLLEKHIDEKSVMNSTTDFGLVTAKLNGLVPLPVKLYKSQIDQGKLIDYLMASSACFPAAMMFNIDNQLYLDGSYCDLLPIEMAIEKKATDILVVDIGGLGVRKKTKHKHIKINYLKSRWGLGNFLVFDQDRIRKNIALGYLETLKHFGKLDGFLYSFKKNSSSLEDEISSFLQCPVFVSVFSMIKNSCTDFRISLRKQPIKKLVLQNTGRMDYRSFYYTCKEISGKIFGMEGFLLYSHEYFNDQLFKRYNKYINSHLKSIKVGKNLFDDLQQKNNNHNKSIFNILRKMNSKTLVVLIANLISACSLDDLENLCIIAFIFPSEFLSGLFFSCKGDFLTIE